MLSREFITFLLAVKMAASQTVYPTTQVSYSTNAVPTVQTFPATVTAVPSAVTATAIPSTAAITTMPTTITATAMPTAVTATAMPTAFTATAMPTAVTATAMPAAVTATSMPATAAVTATAMPTSPMTPTVTLAPSSVPTSAATVLSCPMPTSAPKVTVSPVLSSANPTGPKAYFLPANIPDPKVTILPNDLPTIIETKPKIFNDAYIEAKAICPDYSTPVISRKNSGPMTAVKRVTMACTDDTSTPNDEPICPGIPKMDVTPTPVMRKGINSNPIDFEGLFDSFMTCL